MKCFCSHARPYAPEIGYEGASAPWQFYSKQCSYRRQNSDEVVIAISPRQVVVNTVLSETVEPPRPLHRILLQYCCYSRGWIVMPSETADRSGELYIVEVDGVKNSEHRIFIEALKYGMELKRCFPRSEVKLRDAGENMPRNDTAAPKRIWGIRSGGQVREVETA
jgi:hypothetical protein